MRRVKPRVLFGAMPDDSQTISIGMQRCGVCDGPIYYDPLKPPPPPAGPCLRCMNWAVAVIVELHKRPLVV